MIEKEFEEESRSLFNGENLLGWKAYNSQHITRWKAEAGVLVFTPNNEFQKPESLITEGIFENFELRLGWKISEAGNSGLLWGVKEDEKYDQPHLTGPEIQLLDNRRHPDAKNGPARQAGALYDLRGPASDATKPAEEWNQMALLINHQQNRGKVSLNGEIINEFPLHGDAWDKMVIRSKFSGYPGFGKFRKGHLALQDHGDRVSFRNIRIREMD